MFEPKMMEFLIYFGQWRGHLLLAVKEVILVQKDYQALQVTLQVVSAIKSSENWLLVVMGIHDWMFLVQKGHHIWSLIASDARDPHLDISSAKRSHSI